MAYGILRDEAILKAETLVLRVIAERLEDAEARPTAIHIALPAAHGVSGLPVRPARQRENVLAPMGYTRPAARRNRLAT